MARIFSALALAALLLLPSSLAGELIPATSLEISNADLDGDGLPQSFEWALAQNFLPELWYSNGESCPQPGGRELPGAMMVSVSPWTKAPDFGAPAGSLIIRYVITYWDDCIQQAVPPVWAFPHNGDLEGVVLALVPKPSCPLGYGLFAVSSSAHKGAPGQKENTLFAQGECDTGGGAGLSYFIGGDKHGTYLLPSRCQWTNGDDGCERGWLMGGENAFYAINPGDPVTAEQGPYWVHNELSVLGFPRTLFDRFCPHPTGTVNPFGRCDLNSPASPAEKLHSKMEVVGPSEGVLPTGVPRVELEPPGTGGKWLRWSAVVGASRFQLLLQRVVIAGTNSHLETVLTAEVSGQRWRFPNELGEGFYVLTVVGGNQYGFNGRKGVVSFSHCPGCTTAPSQAPTLLAPTGTSSESPRFEWLPVAGGLEYDLEIYVTFGAEPIFDQRLAAFSYDFPGTLECDVEHSFRVRAVNSFGDGPWSASAVFTPSCEELPPAAATGVRAVPVVGGYDKVDIAWLDNSDRERGYRIQRLRGGDPHPEIIADLPPDTTSFRDEVPRVPEAGGTEYYFYRVIAYNTGGSAGLESERAEARMYGDPPGKPSTLRPRGCIDTTNPLLSWQGGGRSTQFYVRLLDAGSGEEAMPDATPTTNSMALPSPLTPGSSYMLRVWGMNNLGWGLGSEPEYFVPFCTPLQAPELESPPAGCIATTTPEIRFTPVAGALWYHLRINRVGGNDPEIASIGVESPATSWQVPAGLLAAGQEYRVKVKASNGVDGPYSRLRYFVPECTAASLGHAAAYAPSGLVATPLPTYTWEPAAQVETYTVKVIQMVADTFVPVGEATYAATAICDASSCSARPALPLGNGDYRYWVESHKAGSATTIGPHSRYTVALPAAVTVAVEDVALLEGTGGATVARFTLRLSSPAPWPVTVGWTTADGTAAAPADYTAALGTAGFELGEVETTVEVEVNPDITHELDQTFRLLLRNAEGATISDGEAVATLTNDDPPPVVSVSPAVVGELDRASSTALFTVSLSHPTELGASVTYATADCTATAGADYTALTGSVTFAPNGALAATVPVTVRGDALAEGDETFFLALGSGSGATLGESLGDGVIRDNDRTAAIPARADFNADGKSDLLFRNQTSGNHVAWFLDGLIRVNGVALNPAQPAAGNWLPVAEGDFSGDGKADLLWQNLDSGNLSLWLLDGVNRSAGIGFAGLGEAAWKVAASADFDRDGRRDLLFRHQGSGALTVWFMDGATRLGEATIPPPASTLWTIAAAGDLNADGKADLLWRQTASGDLVVWWMDGTTMVGAEALAPAVLDLAWQAVGIWDVDLDGKNDLVWQHQASKRLFVWFMNRASRTCGAYLAPPAPVDANWQAVGPR